MAAVKAAGRRMRHARSPAFRHFHNLEFNQRPPIADAAFSVFIGASGTTSCRAVGRVLPRIAQPLQ